MAPDAPSTAEPVAPPDAASAVDAALPPAAAATADSAASPDSPTLHSKCGIYCPACGYRESTGCRGCGTFEGGAFWGECDKYVCARDRGLEHCGLCGELPCAKLESLCADPVHGGDYVAALRLRTEVGTQEWARRAAASACAGNGPV